MKLIGHIINPAHAPRITAHNTPSRKNNALYRAVLFYRLYGIARAGRIVFAAGLFERRYIFLIQPD